MSSAPPAVPGECCGLGFVEGRWGTGGGASGKSKGPRPRGAQESSPASAVLVLTLGLLVEALHDALTPFNLGFPIGKEGLAAPAARML